MTLVSLNAAYSCPTLKSALTKRSVFDIPSIFIVQSFINYNQVDVEESDSEDSIIVLSTDRERCAVDVTITVIQEGHLLHRILLMCLESSVLRIAANTDINKHT